MIARELDPGIRRYVGALAAAGVETFESCEGGEGHAFQVTDLRRVWSIEDGEPVGPNWELTFS